MSKQPETLFKEKVIRDLRQLGNVWFVKIQMRATRGIPDLLLCINGHFVALELKTEEGVESKLQTYTLLLIKEAGGFSFTVTPLTWPGVLQALMDLEESPRTIALGTPEEDEVH